MPLRHDRFRFLREAKGLSQEVLGGMADVAHSTIAKIERGASPNADTLERLAVALDATMDYFYGRGFEDVDASGSCGKYVLRRVRKRSEIYERNSPAVQACAVAPRCSEDGTPMVLIRRNG